MIGRRRVTSTSCPQPDALQGAGGRPGDGGRPGRFLERGYYAPLRDALCRLAVSLTGPAPAVLDSGCGEGYYTAAIYQALCAAGKAPRMAGTDISKFILRLAAKREKNVEFAVASSYRLPAADGSIDLLLNCFSPLAIEEFRRVLRPEGHFLYVVPSAMHLWEMKQVLYDHPYPNEVKETPYDGFHYVTIRHVEDTIHLKVKRDGEIKEISYKPDVNVRYLLGFNRSDANSMTVESLIKGMPLEEAGLEAGDVITKINGVEVPDGNAYEKYIEEHPLSDEPVTITYERNGLEYEAEITPREYRTPVSGFGYNTYSEKTSGFNVLKYGAVEVKYMIRTTILSLKELVTGHLGMKDLSGPVGVVDAIGDTYEQSKSEGTLMIWMNMLNMAVLLSANLGVMNLLPLPALDGGRLVFLVVEAVRRKPVNRQVEGMIHFAGLMLLMALMVVVMYNDILKIF